MADEFGVRIGFKEQYKNLINYISQEFVDKLFEAGRQYGAKQQFFRGGTDGCRISENGLPCPNVWTGGNNFHSVREYVVVEQALESVAFLVDFIRGFV